MFWKETLLAAAFATAVVAPSAQASWLINANAGVGIPTGDFSDFWASGFLVGAAASYLVRPQFAIGVDGSYLKNDTSDDYQALLDFLDPGAEDQFTYQQYGVHGKWMIPTGSGSRVSPYLVVGAGLYSVKDKYESPTFSDELSQTAFGLRGGAGIDYWVSTTFGVGVDANYHNPFASEEEIGYDSAPFFAVSGGIRWKITSAP